MIPLTGQKENKMELMLQQNYTIANPSINFEGHSVDCTGMRTKTSYGGDD